MKRLGALLLALVCMMTLFGCGNEKRQMYFSASVLEINDGFVKVKCTDAFDSGIPVNAEFSVSTDTVAAGGAPKMAVGDPIRVVFNGEIMESEPIQLGIVYAIYLLDENGDAIPNS